MSDVVKKKLRRYEVTLYETNRANGYPELVPCFSTEVVDTTMTRRKARAALSAAGANPRKGAEIMWEVLGEIVYAMSVEDFIEKADVFGE